MGNIKLYIPLLFLLFNQKQSFCQSNLVSIGVQRTQYLYKQGTGIVVSFNKPVSERLSLQYTAGLGSADGDGVQAHFPATVYAAFAVANFIGSDGRFLAWLTMLIPEGVSYQVHSTQKVDFSIQVSPLTAAHWDSKIEYREDWTPNAGVILWIKNKKSNPFIRLDGTLLYLPLRNNVAVQVAGSLCIKFN